MAAYLSHMSDEPTSRPQRSSIPAIDPNARFLNRDYSWLEFNRRVLLQATFDAVPLLERVKFLAIFASNLDEFFMKRIGLLKSRHDQHSTSAPQHIGETPPIKTIRGCVSLVREMEAQLIDCLENQLMPKLEAEGIHIRDYNQLPEELHRRVDRWFRNEVFPILTPLAVDPGHRFPFISNLSENLGLLIEPIDQTNQADRQEPRFARVKIPDVLPHYIRVDTLPEEDSIQINQASQTNTSDPASDTTDAPPSPEHPAIYIPLDEIVIHNLADLFPGMRITEILPFRLTRSAAVELDDEDVEDLLEHVEEELRMRRFADTVRIQTPPNPSPTILNFLLRELELTKDDHFVESSPLARVDLFEIARIDRPDLLTPVWNPVRPAALADPQANIFETIRQRDILVHHPYESFSDSVERFINAAADDPDVLAIKLTLYRTSRDSPFVDTLIKAAQDGKQVACLVELRARFDEEKNVAFARQLEAAGVHVAYGVVGHKTHSKCSLVVRREQTEGQWGLRSYAHVSTGNYHPSTAQRYTDLGLLTANEEITGDIVRLFNRITGLSAGQTYKELIVAPDHMRAHFMSRIQTEIDNAKAGKPAMIFAKMNAMEDRRITEALYEASNAGVKITLIVRGFCCLRPGIKGMSENITVRSIIGQFLEHSRIYVFADGSDDPKDYQYAISSADWMYRNLSTRVEAACPILDLHAKDRLWQIIRILLDDRQNAWQMNPDGSYTHLTPDREHKHNSPQAIGSFSALSRRAIKNTHDQE